MEITTFWRWILLVWLIVGVKRVSREQKINVIFLCFGISYFLLCVYLSMQILFWLARFAKIQVYAGKDFIMYPMATNGWLTLSPCTEKITIFVALVPIRYSLKYPWRLQKMLQPACCHRQTPRGSVLAKSKLDWSYFIAYTPSLWVPNPTTQLLGIEDWMRTCWNYQHVLNDPRLDSPLKFEVWVETPTRRSLVARYFRGHEGRGEA